MVLIAVLWSIALLSALAMAASMTFRGFAGIMAVERNKLQAEALLTAGLEMAASAIESLGETPLNEIEITVNLSTGSVRARLSDEGGRIDIGKAPVEVLVALFRYIGAQEAAGTEIAQRIVEQRRPTPDDRAGGADRPFTDVRQLARVPGMEPEWVRAVAPLTTVFGNATVNPLTAPAEVIAALPGVDQGRLDAFLQTRRNLGDASMLGATLGATQRYLQVNAQQVVSVHLAATLVDGYTDAAQAIIVRLPQDTQPYRVLVWDPLPSSYSL